MMHFKVKFGFANDDFITIDESEVSRAMKAQVSGKVGIFKNGTISGDKIISITPDINSMMGWNRTYQPTSEDYGDVPKKILNEHRMLLENTLLAITGKRSEDVKNLPPSEFSQSLAEKMRV